jgi:hypothetical protein
LYQAILKIVGKFSGQVDWIVLDIDKLEIDFKELESLNPSAEKLAKEVRKLSELIKAIGNLIDYDYSVQNIAINAAQSAVYLELVAVAIENNDAINLKYALEQLR